MKFALLFLLPLLLFTTSCKSTENATKAADYSYLQLKQGGCFGTCPIYDLRIMPDGTATYDGKRYAPYKGLHTATVQKDSLARINALVSEALAKRASIPSVFESNIADLPWSTIHILHDSDTVKFTGNSNFQEPIGELRESLINLANSASWVRSPDAKPLPPHKLELTLTDMDYVDKLQGEFFMQQFQIIQRLDNDPPRVLVSFDPFAMSAEEMIRDLKRHKQVTEVKLHGLE